MTRQGTSSTRNATTACGATSTTNVKTATAKRERHPSSEKDVVPKKTQHKSREGAFDHFKSSRNDISSRYEISALLMEQVSCNAAVKDARIMSSKEECALGMEQKKECSAAAEGRTVHKKRGGTV